jgi:predicted RNase H-like HicB family nuclease
MVAGGRSRALTVFRMHTVHMSNSTFWQNFLSVFRRSARRFEAERTEEKASFKFDIVVCADEDDGGFIAEVQGFPGVLGQGETPDEALHAAVDVLQDVLELRFEAELKRRAGTPGLRTGHVTLAV